MSREVPFDKEAVCDVCDAKGAYDFMGDLLCPSCAAIESDEDEPDEYDITHE